MNTHWMMIRLLYFSFFCLLLSPQVRAQSKLPDLTLSLQITHADHQSYRTIPFEVPSGVERLSIETTYSQKDQKTVVDLGLLDPNGKIVGWSGGNKDRFTLSAIDATPSYSPHAIDQGQWQLLLGIPNIREGVTSTFQAKIYFSNALSSTTNPPWVNLPLKSQPGWYRGDLHLHSAHSDGSCQNSSKSLEVPCPVFLIAQKAHELKLDFIALSDHNAVSQANSIREMQPYYDNLLLMASRELTSFYGHANLTGSFNAFDFRATDSVKGWAAPLKSLQNATTPTFVSINHPNFPNGEICMGCGWTFDSSVLNQGLIHGVEVANGDDMGSSFSGFSFWLKQLEKGLKLTAVAGSDNHHVDQSEETRSFLGRPTNVVFAKELSTHAITSALLQGHTYIDFYKQGDSKPKRSIDFVARFNNQEFMMGDQIEMPKSSQDVVIQLQLQNAQGDRARLHVSPNMMTQTELGLIGSQSYQSEFKINLPIGLSWIFLELYDNEGRLNLLTNPIYFNKK
jgi:hypothetical protein